FARSVDGRPRGPPYSWAMGTILAWGEDLAGGTAGEDAGLREALADPDPFVRVRALGGSDAEEGAVRAIAFALGDDYPMVRREAVRALSRAGGSMAAARALLDAAAHDPSAEVRAEAVTALAGILRAQDASAGF